MASSTNDPIRIMRARARDIENELKESSDPERFVSAELTFRLVVQMNEEIVSWLDRYPALDVMTIFLPCFKQSLLALHVCEQALINNVGLYSAYVAGLLPQLKADLAEIAAEHETSHRIRRIRTDYH